MRLFHTKNQSGFSLLELLVVIAIMATTFGFSFAGYNNYTSKKALEGEVKKMVDVLELAKQKTISTDTTALPTCAPFNGYKVRSVSPSSYKLQIMCGNPSTDTDVATYQLPGSVNVVQNQEVSFGLPNGAAVSNPANTPFKFFTYIPTTTTKCIQVNPSGLIEEIACP